MMRFRAHSAHFVAEYGPPVADGFVAEFAMRNWPAEGGEIGNWQSLRLTVSAFRRFCFLRFPSCLLPQCLSAKQ
jgi:hypothetical protein